MNNDSVAVAERPAQSHSIDQALATWRARCDDVVFALSRANATRNNLILAEAQAGDAQTEYDYALARRRDAEEAYVATLRQDGAAA